MDSPTFPTLTLAACLLASRAADAALPATTLEPPPAVAPSAARAIGSVVAGVAVADLAVAAGTLTVLPLTARDETVRRAHQAAWSTGALPYVAAASLVIVGASGLAAGAGHNAAGGALADAPRRIAGAMFGALAGALVASPPGLSLLGEADRVSRTQPVELGDAISTGIQRGVADMLGVCWVAITPLLVAPVAAGAAFAAAAFTDAE